MQIFSLFSLNLFLRTIQSVVYMYVCIYVCIAASVPAGKKVTEYDYRRLEVAVGAVRMMRVPAGVGLIK